jgi:hypothetical protein
MFPGEHLLKEKETALPNLMKDADFLEYLEENSVPEEETQIAFAAWLKENQQ